MGRLTHIWDCWSFYSAFNTLGFVVSWGVLGSWREQREGPTKSNHISSVLAPVAPHWPKQNPQQRLEMNQVGEELVDLCDLPHRANPNPAASLN